MARYQVQHPYAAFRDGRQFGPWDTGEQVELDPVDADWVNRDSPGTLTEPKSQPKSQPKSGPAGRAAAAKTAKPQRGQPKAGA